MEQNASGWLRREVENVVNAEPRTSTRMLGWNVPASELSHIPEHWFAFPEPDPVYNYTIGLINFCFLFVSLFGNGAVIWIFITSKALRTPSNMFVVTLALFDFFMMVKTPIVIYNSFNLGFELGNWGCQIFGFIGAITGIGQSTTNVAIAYDRYSTIANPLEGKLSRSKAFIIVLVIIAYTIPWAVMPLLQIWGRFVPEGYLTTCSFDYLTDNDRTRFFVASIFFFSYCIPMTMIIFYYSQIVGHVVNHEKALREQAKKMNVDSLRSNQNQHAQSAEVRICKAAITICFLFVASWTPYGVLALIGAFGNKSLLTPSVTMIPAITCKLVACIDPYVYAISHPRFRLELQKRLPFLNINEPTPPTETSSTGTEATSGAVTS